MEKTLTDLQWAEKLHDKIIREIDQKKYYFGQSVSYGDCIDNSDLLDLLNTYRRIISKHLNEIINDDKEAK